MLNDVGLGSGISGFPRPCSHSVDLYNANQHIRKKPRTSHLQSPDRIPLRSPSSQSVSEPTASYDGVGWSCGNPHDYERGYCVDLVQLSSFLQATQPDVADKLALSEDGPTRQKFLHQLRNQISNRGTIHVLRNGIMHGQYKLALFYGTPSPGNETAKERFGQNRFTVTRQLRYSLDQTQNTLDIGLFIKRSAGIHVRA